MRVDLGPMALLTTHTTIPGSLPALSGLPVQDMFAGLTFQFGVPELEVRGSEVTSESLHASIRHDQVRHLLAPFNSRQNQTMFLSRLASGRFNGNTCRESGDGMYTVNGPRIARSEVPRYEIVRQVLAFDPTRPELIRNEGVLPPVSERGVRLTVEYPPIQSIPNIVFDALRRAIYIANGHRIPRSGDEMLITAGIGTFFGNCIAESLQVCSANTINRETEFLAQWYIRREGKLWVVQVEKGDGPYGWAFHHLLTYKIPWGMATSSRTYPKREKWYRAQSVAVESALRQMTDLNQPTVYVGAKKRTAATKPQLTDMSEINDLLYDVLSWFASRRSATIVYITGCVLNTKKERPIRPNSRFMEEYGFAHYAPHKTKDVTRLRRMLTPEFGTEQTEQFILALRSEQLDGGMYNAKTGAFSGVEAVPRKEN